MSLLCSVLRLVHRRLLLATLWLPLAWAPGGCGSTPDVVPDRAAVGQPVNTLSSLFEPALEPTGLNDDGAVFRVDGDHVILRRDAMGAAMLLRPQSIVAGNAPQVNLGAARLVHFALKGHTLVLMEPALHAVYTNLPTDRLLETFVVTEQDATHVRFRWDFGLHNVSLRQSDAPADIPLLVEAYLDAAEPVLPVQDAFVQDMAVVQGALQIHQVARVRVDRLPWSLFGLVTEGQALMPTDETIYLAFSLAPLNDNPSFTPQVQKITDAPRYFQVAHRRPGESDVDFITMRWAHGPKLAPIAYHLAANTPQELIAPITEGVLYWNRALGYPLVTVVMGEAPGLLAEARHVPIRWIPWRTAGFSIAEVQPNPLTGEILAAEIFLTSAFYEPSGQMLAHGENLALPIRAGQPTCAWSNLGSTSSLWTTTPPMGAHFVQRAMADKIRSVVAHEVGHTLGLRHNFAASLQSTLATPHAREDAWRAYSRGTSDGAATASSVMDYFGDMDGVLLGGYIRTGTLPFDSETIAQGYDASNANVPLGQSPWLFCTDGERLTGVLGCRIFDSSPNPFAGALAEAQLIRRHLPLQLLSTLGQRIQANTPLDKAAQEQLIRDIEPEQFSVQVARVTRELFDGLRSDVRVLPTERTMGHLRVIDPDAYRAAGRTLRAQWLDTLGGLPSILDGILGPVTDGDTPLAATADGFMAQVLNERLAGLSPDPQGKEGQDNAERFSPEQLQFLRGYGPKWANAMEHAVLRDVLISLTGGLPQADKEAAPSLLAPPPAQDTGGMDPTLVHTAWEAPLARRAMAHVLAQKGTLTGTRNNERVSVVAATLPVDARLAALRLLSPDVFHRAGWGQQARDTLVQMLMERLLTLVPKVGSGPGLNMIPVIRALGPNALADYLDLPSLDGPLQNWALGELQILRALMVQNAAKRTGAQIPFAPAQQGR